MDMDVTGTSTTQKSYAHEDVWAAAVDASSDLPPEAHVDLDPTLPETANWIPDVPAMEYTPDTHYPENQSGGSSEKGGHTPHIEMPSTDLTTPDRPVVPEIVPAFELPHLEFSESDQEAPAEAPTQENPSLGGTPTPETQAAPEDGAEAVVPLGFVLDSQAEADSQSLDGVLELTISPRSIENPLFAPTDGGGEIEVEDQAFLDELKNIPDKMAFKIGEAADIIGVKQYVLRYWETEFDVLKPKKSAHNQRMFSRRDVETAILIKKLLYKDRFSIEGARKALRQLRKKVKVEREKESAFSFVDEAIEQLHDIREDLGRLRRLFA